MTASNGNNIDRCLWSPGDTIRKLYCIEGYVDPITQQPFASVAIEIPYAGCIRKYFFSIGSHVTLLDLFYCRKGYVCPGILSFFGWCLWSPLKVQERGC